MINNCRKNCSSKEILNENLKESGNLVNRISFKVMTLRDKRKMKTGKTKPVEKKKMLFNCRT